MIQSFPRCDDDGADGNGDATRKRIMSRMYDDDDDDDDDRLSIIYLVLFI